MAMHTKEEIMFNFWKRSGTDNRDNQVTANTESNIPNYQINTPHNNNEQQLSKFEIVASIQTDKGCVRSSNEDNGRYVVPSDSAILINKGVLAIVADGMGGHSAGEVASQIAVEVVSQVYYQYEGEHHQALEQAFKKANASILEAARKDNELRGMGTTCTALVLCNNLAYAAHVGDSRLYMVRDNQLYLMTEDHSAVMEMVKHGIIKPEEARHHPDKNVILRALGTNPNLEVSTWSEPVLVQEGDTFLLCSDGLYDLVEDEEILQILISTDPFAAGEQLINLAKQRGGHDNITVAILNLKPEGFTENRTMRDTRELEISQ
jgi:PPM family protein phosphatase